MEHDTKKINFLGENIQTIRKHRKMKQQELADAIGTVSYTHLANVLGNGVSAHPCVLAYASDTGPALVRFPVLTENQVGIERHFYLGA